MRGHAGHPSIDFLKDEGVDIVRQPKEVKPLRIAVLNLMPIKITTETDLIRLLSSSTLPVEITLIEPSSHVSKTTPAEHLAKFYMKFKELGEDQFDGLIITGAPLERVDFENVDYWEELKRVMDDAKKYVRSTLYICWAAFAGLYYRYGISKNLYDSKISGVFAHNADMPESKLLSGFDDEFYVPHSRFIGFDRKEVESCGELEIISSSDDAGIYIIGEKNGNDFYITGHSEYSPLTLDTEYHRDLGKGMNPQIPKNYYKNDNPDLAPVVKWRAHSRLLFNNWLNYYVAPQPVCGIEPV
ncbi:MAG: homoserine O-succinyltransferase [Paramuribaculum sp.]|nr:homoserine O-succinyltransferase [Paramuribaculum sp.]